MKPDLNAAFLAAIAELGAHYEVVAFDDREFWQLVLALVGRGDFVRARIVQDAIARAAKQVAADAARGRMPRCGHCYQRGVRSVVAATKFVLFLPRMQPYNVLVQVCCTQCSELPRQVLATNTARYIASIVPGCKLDGSQ